MELIILGSSASYALPDEATSGYLIKSKNHSLAIDLGTGTLSNLFRWQDPADLDALMLSHLHVDHFADIYPLRLYLNFERPQKTLDVFAPKDADSKLISVLSTKGKKIFERVLRFREIKEETFSIGDFKITAAKVVHDIDSFAIRIETGSKSLVYSSDTAYNKKLVKLAGNADILLAEATLNKPVEGVRHMTVEDASRLASEAKVKQLVLTHIWPTFKDEKIAEEASNYFNGKIDIACANKVFKI